MTRKNVHTILNLIIAVVWFINGFFCKILNLVPRHEMIVAEIVNEDYSRILTVLIGISELVMVVWILSRFRSRINAITQILIIIMMNIMEFILVPDLLMWGRLNIVFALLFTCLIYFNEFILNQHQNTANQ